MSYSIMHVVLDDDPRCHAFCQTTFLFQVLLFGIIWGMEISLQTGKATKSSTLLWVSIVFECVSKIFGVNTEPTLGPFVKVAGRSSYALP